MSTAYDTYLMEHTGNVVKAYRWLKENLPQFVPDDNIVRDAGYGYSMFINEHDNSKYYNDEYAAYDAYFYGDDKDSPLVKEAFDLAWLKHIHRNPHHWQHWVLYEDDGKGGPRALEMPLPFVIEMISDWWSFSWKSGNLMEIFDWYDKHSDIMILHPNTRKTVESILNAMKTILEVGVPKVIG